MKNRYTIFIALVAAFALAFIGWKERSRLIAFARQVKRGINPKAAQSADTIPSDWFYAHGASMYSAGNLLQIPDPDSTDSSIYENAQSGAQLRLFGGV